MGAYAYCQRPDCGVPLDAPTAHDIAYGSWTCAAGHANTIPEDALVQIVADLVERVESLERALNELAELSAGADL
jgi:hypothetical protein